MPVGLAAVRAGKDVYIEKPLGHTLAQNKAMLDACVKHDRIFQYGTQQRSQEILKRGIELVLNGNIGEIERIDVWAPQRLGRRIARRNPGAGRTRLRPLPRPRADEALHQGPHHQLRLPGIARTTRSASSPAGARIRWTSPSGASITTSKGPFKIRGTGTVATPDALFNTITSWDVEIEFAGGIKMHFMSDDIAKPIVDAYRKNWDGDGTTFFGPKGWISLSRGGYAASNPGMVPRKTGRGRQARALSEQLLPSLRRFRARPHARPSPRSSDAVRSDALSHLSVLAIQSGGEVVWDPKAYRIVSPECAQRPDVARHPRRVGAEVDPSLLALEQREQHHVADGWSPCQFATSLMFAALALDINFPFPASGPPMSFLSRNHAVEARSQHCGAGVTRLHGYGSAAFISKAIF